MRGLLTLALVAAVATAEEAGDVPAAFEWRQLLGSATHDNFRAREDSVLVPKVIWHAPDAIGQPTLSDGWLYAGGPVLGRYSDSTGKFERAQAADARAVRRTPVITPDALIVRRPDRTIEAYTPDLRRRIWQTATRAPINSHAHPLAWHGDLVIANCGSTVLALRLRDGKVQWRFETGRGGVAMTPAISGGRVFFGCTAGNAWALDLATGKQLWQLPGAVSYGGPHPVVVDGTLFLAERCVPFENKPDPFGKVFGIDAARGKVRWWQGYGITGVSTPGTSPERVVFGGFRNVMQLNPKSGKEMLPKITIDRGAFGTPAIVGSTLYLGTTGSLEARDLRTGDVKWRLRIPGVTSSNRPHVISSIVHTGTRIYVDTSNGLYCLGQDPNRRGVRPQNLTVTAPG